MSIDIDLGQVQEKEPLRVAEYIFSVKDTPLVQATKDGHGEVLVIDFVPEGFPEEGFRHWFSLTRDGVESKSLRNPSPTSSLKKFLAVLGYPNVRIQGEVGQPLRVTTDADGSEVLLKYLRFRGTIKHEFPLDADGKPDKTQQPNIRLNRVDGAA